MVRYVFACLIGLWIAAWLAPPLTTAAAASATTEGAPPRSDGRPSVRLFTDKDGLPQNTVLSMDRDMQGYFWIGTRNGAAYYNGRTWRAVALPNATASNGVRALQAMSDGSVWFGTLSAGIHRLKNGRWTTYDKASGALPHDRIRAILESRPAGGPSVVWVATGGGGLARCTQDKWTTFTTRNSGLPDDNVEALYESVAADGRRTLWVGTNGGLAKFDVDAGAWTAFTTVNSGAPSNRIATVLETVSASGARSLWVGFYGGGLARLDAGRWEIWNVANGKSPSDNVQRLCAIPSATGGHAFWAGTDGGGVFRYDDGVRTHYNLRNSILPDDSIVSLRPEISPDGRRRLWVGTFNGGLTLIEESGWKAYDTRNSGLPRNVVTTILETPSATGRGNTLWFGTDGGGLAALDDGRWTVHDASNSPLPSNQVYGLTPAAGGGPALWAATNGGLARFAQGRWTTVYTTKNSGLPNNQVYCALEEGDAAAPVLWAGTFGGGLTRFADGRWETFTTQNSGLRSNIIRSLATVTVGRTRALAVATRGGGVCLKIGDRWLTFHRLNSALPNDDVESLLETVAPDGRRVLIVGTFGGAAQIDLGGESPKVEPLYNAELGPSPSSVICKVCEDAQKRLYLCTYKGVIRLTPRRAANGSVTFDRRDFTVEDGLPSNATTPQAGLYDAEGRIWVGTSYGAAALSPAEVIDDRTPKPLRIERTLVNGEVRGAGADAETGEYVGPGGGAVDGATLSHRQNSVLFEYALLSEFRETETRYRVQLQGFDAAPSEWTAEARKEYTNLEAGDYAFLVWGRDWAGNESGPVEVRFRVAPAPWRTGWAYALYAVMFGGALYGGARVRVRALERRNRLLEERIAERTAELARKNEEISEAKDEVERKNAALDDKINELARKNEELLISQRRADRIFSALAEALPGTVLDGKYRLDAKIGAGGYGAVFRGMHLTLNRPIAIKVFRPQGGNDSPEALERFRQEGVSACRIAHPNAVAVLDSGISTEGVAYLVMELLTGYSLAQELRAHHQLSLRRCAEIIVPVCRALAEAHRIGVIHRDIKPENVFLHYGAEGEIVKVVDFGIAKFLGADSREEDFELTATEGIVGTPAYIAPERISKKTYDGRSDIYSVGVTLYQMLAGALPFDSDSGVWGAILKSLTQPPPPLREKRPEIPPEIERIVMRTLEKDPVRRPTANDLAQELAAAAARFAPTPMRGPSVGPETRRVHAVKITNEEGRRTADAPTLADASEADGGETIDATRIVVPDDDDAQPTRRG